MTVEDIIKALRHDHPFRDGINYPMPNMSITDIVVKFQVSYEDACQIKKEIDWHNCIVNTHNLGLCFSKPESKVKFKLGAKDFQNLYKSWHIK
jgi:hypothetical protein